MQGETVLCISTAAWNGLWRPIHQTMSRIAHHNLVLFFEPGRNPERRHSSEMRRNCPNFYRLCSQRLDQNLVVIATPPCLPYMRQHLPRAVLQVTVPWVARINAWILIRHVRWAMRALDVHEPILWLYEPRHIHLVGRLGEKLVCYYNYDEGPEYMPNRRIKELLREYDDRLSRRADVVMATGRAQWERRKKLNPDTYFIPNAVDFDLFSTALVHETPIPSDVAQLKEPRIGYVGWLGYQIDVDLLLRVATAYPDASLILVGPDEIPTDERLAMLRAMANVHFLGRKALTELPGYLKAFDAALIPYVLASYTLTAYPLKLHEYLAAGRAVVATALPEVRPYSHVVRIAASHDEFVRQIGEALRDNSPQAIHARVAVARENTWDQRVAEIYRVLQHHLAATAQQRAR